MEYGLRPYVDLDETLYYLSVLILVLMEYGLRLIPEESKEAILNCLNPCFNGIWSATTSNKRDVYCYVCLNPCFNGIWSATHLARI